MAGWPFWAATSDERIEQALDMVRLQPGERLLDVGCGDGRVLLRAAVYRDAVVTGIELDPELAAAARALLREHDVDGDIIEADFTEASLQADVIFAFLSPATLQRLRPRLASLDPSTRIVTTGYPVPGWQPKVAGGRCFVYSLPPVSTAPAGRPGWASDGVLIAVQPATPALVAVKWRAPHATGEGNPSVAVEPTVEGDELGANLTVRAGADDATPGEEIVIDLRIEPLAAGVSFVGDLRLAGDDFGVVVVVDDAAPGLWGLGSDGTDRARYDDAARRTLLVQAREAPPVGSNP